MSGNAKDSLAGLSPEEKRALLRRLLAEKQKPLSEFPLSQHQLAMWFLHCLAPGMTSYNTALTVEATPSLEVAALVRAFEKLAQRHPALRLVFSSRNGVPVQRIAESAGGLVHTVELPGADGEQLRDAVVAAYRRPLDLEKSPMRVVLFQCGARDVLLIVLHHIVFDGWSANILYRELRSLYEQELGLSVADLPPVGAGYHNFVEWQSRMIESQDGERHWQYWSERLSNVPAVLDLPLRKPLSSTPVFTGGSIPLRVEGPVYQQLKDIVRQQRTTIFAVMTTIYSVLLYRISCQKQFLIGTPVSGRTRPEWSGIVGDFINMLPLRMDLDPDLPLINHLETVSSEIRNALVHQDFPFSLMVERLRAPRSARSPLFQTMINVYVARARSEVSQLFENGGAMPFGSSYLRHYMIPQQEGQFDLRLELLDTGEALLGGLHYSDDAFDHAAAAHMADVFSSLLEQVAADPSSRIGDYSIDTFNDPPAIEHFVI